jgi:hypothetical protein
MHAFCLVALLAGCGNNSTTYTVGGHTLTVAAQAYTIASAEPFFCDTLDFRGQFGVYLTDFDLCGMVRQHKNATTIFHEQDETNLRLVFPSTLVKVAQCTMGATSNLCNTDTTKTCNTVNDCPRVPTFHVGATDCSTMHGPQAVAWFAHDSGAHGQGSGVPPYDFIAQADGGTITVTSFDQNSGAVQGSFDLTFGADHIAGGFNAVNCAGLDSTFGR